jgi:molybdate transport repressor ModE-like protein
MTLLSELWDTTRMRLLVEIDRRGSLSAAAQAVGIGQPSASQHLRTLEAAAGQRLVQRNGRGSRLTEAGGVLAAHAAQALATLAAGEQELGALAGLQTGTIRLGASTAPGSYLLPDTLGCFRRDYPSVNVEIEIAASGEILRRLLSGRIELAIVGVDQADERIALEPFLADEIVGVAKAGLVATENGTLAPRALADVTLLCREPDSSSRGYVERELRAIGVQPARVWELGSTEGVKRAAREGLGVGFLSGYAVAEEIERGELEVFRLRGRPPLTRTFQIARLAGRPLSPAESVFVETLTRCCGKQSAYAEACVAGSAAR